MKTELEALESIYYYIVATGSEDDYKKYYERIKEALKDAKKYKRIVEIIRDKLGMTFNTNGIYKLVEEGVLSKEEYDLLNEVFDYD